MRARLFFPGCARSVASHRVWSRVAAPQVDRTGPISMANVRLLNRFTGLVDEEWFFKTHIIIESEAAAVVHALQRGLEALGGGAPAAPGGAAPPGSGAPDPEALLLSLRALEGALWRVARVCLPIMFERAEGQGALCDYSMFYNRCGHRPHPPLASPPYPPLASPRRLCWRGTGASAGEACAVPIPLRPSRAHPPPRPPRARLHAPAAPPAPRPPCRPRRADPARPLACANSSAAGRWSTRASPAAPSAAAGACGSRGRAAPCPRCCRRSTHSWASR